MKKDGKGIFWASYGSQQWGWAGAGTEITAHVLGALIEADDKSTMPAQIVRSLSKRSTGNSWKTTKQTATVILAMCRYVEKFGASAGESADIDFDINGVKKVNIKYNPKDLKYVNIIWKSNQT